MSHHRIKVITRYSESEDDDYGVSSCDDSSQYGVSPDTVNYYTFDPNRKFNVTISNKTNNEPFVKEDDFLDETPDLSSETTQKMADVKLNIVNNNYHHSESFPTHLNNLTTPYNFPQSSPALPPPPPQPPSQLSMTSGKSSGVHLKNKRITDLGSKNSSVPRAQSPRNNNSFKGTPSTNVSASMSSAVTPQSRQDLLRFYEETKKNYGDRKGTVNVVVIGHVDAGKSTLMGHLLVQLGEVDSKTVNLHQRESKKMGKSSFAFAWIMDQTMEERERGVTMDVFQTSFETPQRKVVVLDAPGHRDFIHKMIGGASLADVAILVVNASKGEFESGFHDTAAVSSQNLQNITPGYSSGVTLTGGQTREHAIIARTLGITQFIVVVNKMDMVPIDLVESRFAAIKEKLTIFLENQLQVKKVLFCPVSGLLGLNVTKKFNLEETPHFNWYKGPCLLDLIDVLDVPERNLDAPVRFTVQDIFRQPNTQGSFVSGRVDVGGLSSSGPHSKLVIVPGNVPVEIKSIIGPGDTKLPFAFVGDNVSLQVNVENPLSIDIGYLFCDSTAPLIPSNRFRVNILLVHMPYLILPGFQAHLHVRGDSTGITLTKLLRFVGKINKNRVDKKNPKSISNLGQVEAVMEADKAICMEMFEKNRNLGKFLLLHHGKTIAGGSVLKVLRNLDKE